MRKRLFLLIFSAFFVPAAVQAQPTSFTTYRLVPLGVIDLPGDAKGSDESFRIRKDGLETSIELESSIPHFDDRSITCDGQRPIYKLNKPNIFAFSCKIGAYIKYHITKYGKTYMEGDSFGTEEIGYSIFYPANQQRYWGPIVTHMTQSLRFAR